MNKLKTILINLKYPFYRVYENKKCVWTESIYDSIPEGWRKAFGREMSRDLKQAVRKCVHKARKEGSRHIDKSQFLDISLIRKKEGKMYIACSAVDDTILKIIKKYSLLSYCYCEYCGKPARYLVHLHRNNKSYICEDCDRHKKFEGMVIHQKLGLGDIPVITDYDIEREDNNLNNTVKTRKVNIKEEYGIDFEEMWGLK